MYTFEVEWETRWSPATPHYKGTETIHTNYDDVYEAGQRAKREIARRMCFSLTEIKIVEIRRGGL